MKQIKYLLLIVSVIFGSNYYTQDKIQLMNGKVLRGKIKGTFDDYYTFDYYKKKGKVKSLELTKYRMFSITDAKGNETILYKQDSLMGGFFSENEMRMYIYGQRDAYNSYQKGPMLILSFGLGLASVLADTYQPGTNASCSQGFFHRTPSIAPIIVPFVLTIGSGLFRTKVRKENASDISFLNSEHYIEGFQKVTKFSRLKTTLIGSAAGVVVGFIAYSIGHQGCP